IAGIDVGEYGASARVTVGTGDPPPVDVRLELTFRYPSGVRAVVEAVRAAVAVKLDRLAGHRMRSLAVTVTGLRGPSAPAPARLREARRACCVTPPRAALAPRARARCRW